MSWWSKDKDALLRQALMCDNRDDLRISGGYRTWEQVAQIMYSLEDRVSATLVKECHERYNDHIIFTMESVDLANFALMYPPWRTEEFEHLRSQLHYSMPGGRSGNPDLAWDAVTRRMNEAHIIIDNFKGVTEVDYFSRTYVKHSVYLAWKVRILPQYNPAEEQPGFQVKYPLLIDLEDSGGQDDHPPSSVAEDQGMEDARPQILVVEDERVPDKRPPRTGAEDQRDRDSHRRYPLIGGQGTLDLYSAADDQGTQAKLPQYSRTEKQGAQNVLQLDSGPKDQSTQYSNYKARKIANKPQGTDYRGMSGGAYSTSYDQETQETRYPGGEVKASESKRQRVGSSSFHKATDQTQSIPVTRCPANEPQTQKPPSEAVRKSRRRHSDDFLDPIGYHPYHPPVTCWPPLPEP